MSETEQDNAGCYVILAIVIIVGVVIAIMNSCNKTPEPTPTFSSSSSSHEEPTELPPTSPPSTEPVHLGEIEPEEDVVNHASMGSLLEQLFDTALLYSNDEIEVEKGGTALLNLVDGISMRLGNETNLAFSAPEETIWTQIELFRGGFLATVPTTEDDEPAVFPLPGGGHILIHGTEFMFVYDDINGEAWVANFDGGVDVVSGETTVTVPPGEYTHLEDSQPPDPPLPLNPTYDEYAECESLMLDLESPVALARLVDSADHDFQVSLVWDTVNDLDLIVYDPEDLDVTSEEAEEEIPEIEIAVEAEDISEAVEETVVEEVIEMPVEDGYYYDANAGCNNTTTAPVETYYTDDNALRGTYMLKIVYAGVCDGDGPQDFNIVVQVGGTIVEVYEGTVTPDDYEILYFNYP